MNKIGRNNIIDKLNSLTANNDLPLHNIASGSTLYRLQRAGHTEGFHYHAPSSNLGRYNDPDGKVSVCYVANLPEIAMGEIILREGHTELSVTDIELWDMAQLKTKRTLSMLDLGRLMPKIGLKLDELTSPSYRNCQEIVRYFSRNPHPDVQGIKYISRHLAYGACYAMFAPQPDETLLETDKMTNLSQFRCVANDKDSEEILTDVLGVVVTGV